MSESSGLRTKQSIVCVGKECDVLLKIPPSTGERRPKLGKAFEPRLAEKKRETEGRNRIKVDIGTGG